MVNLQSLRTNRRTAVICAASAVVLGKPSQAFTAPAVLQDSGSATLEVWGGVPVENGPGDLIEGFQAAFPEIAVNYTHYVNDDTGNTQLDTALQGGTPIDVFFT